MNGTFWAIIILAYYLLATLLPIDKLIGKLYPVFGGLLTWFAISNDSGFQTVWRYFSWSNQTLAMIALWVATAYLLKKGKYRFGSLMTAFPAAFMTAVSLTYLLMAQEGFRLNQTVSYVAGICVAVVLFVIYLIALIRKNKTSQ